MVKIFVDGDVIPAARPRLARNGHAYQPKRNVDYRARVSASARAAMKEKSPLQGELCAAVKVYRKYPASSKRFGDVDNLLKSLFDGCNGIVFDDDSQIVYCSVAKSCDKENPRAEIVITKAGVDT